MPSLTITTYNNHYFYEFVNGHHRLRCESNYPLALDMDHPNMIINHHGYRDVNRNLWCWTTTYLW